MSDRPAAIVGSKATERPFEGRGSRLDSEDKVTSPINSVEPIVMCAHHHPGEREDEEGATEIRL